jgi:hypothetical protein
LTLCLSAVNRHFVTYISPNVTFFSFYTFRLVTLNFSPEIPPPQKKDGAAEKPNAPALNINLIDSVL